MVWEVDADVTARVGVATNVTTGISEHAATLYFITSSCPCLPPQSLEAHNSTSLGSPFTISAYTSPWETGNTLLFSLV